MGKPQDLTPIWIDPDLDNAGGGKEPCFKLRARPSEDVAIGQSVHAPVRAGVEGT